MPHSAKQWWPAAWQRSSIWCWDGTLVPHETLLTLCTGAGTSRTCSSEDWIGGKCTGASGQLSSSCSARPACSTSPLESWTAAAATRSCLCTPAGSDQARTQQCLPACIWQPGSMLPGRCRGRCGAAMYGLPAGLSGCSASRPRVYAQASCSSCCCMTALHCWCRHVPLLRAAGAAQQPAAAAGLLPPAARAPAGRQSCSICPRCSHPSLRAAACSNTCPPYAAAQTPAWTAESAPLAAALSDSLRTGRGRHSPANLRHCGRTAQARQWQCQRPKHSATGWKCEPGPTRWQQPVHLQTLQAVTTMRQPVCRHLPCAPLL